MTAGLKMGEKSASFLFAFVTYWNLNWFTIIFNKIRFGSSSKLFQTNRKPMSCMFQSLSLCPSSGKIDLKDVKDAAVVAFEATSKSAKEMYVWVFEKINK